MNPVSLDIMNLLVEDGKGEFASTKEITWGLFIAEEPPTPNQTVTVYDVMGSADKVYSGGSNHAMRSLFQVRVRGNSYMASFEKIEQCRKALDRRGKFRVSNVDYDNILMDPEPMWLKKDDNQRHIFVINGIAFRQERG